MGAFWRPEYLYDALLIHLARSNKHMARFQQGSKKGRSKFVPATGALIVLLSAGVNCAHATCSAAGTIVTCDGAANPLSPSYTNSANNLKVTVDNGASVGVLLAVGGTAMSLSGSNITLTNNGTIDPTALGSGLSILSSGALIGNASASTTTVVNNGTLNGTRGISLSGSTGMALAVQNGGGGTTSITNTGTIGSSPIIGATLTGADAPVVMAYGGAQVNFTNSGTITGRISFDAVGTSGAGNMFTNSGTIYGSVYLGANSTNTFIATTDSSVNADGGTGSSLNVGVGATILSFAATGTVDGGTGGNNTLELDQGIASQASINISSYIDFQHLQVNSGTWSLSGASTVTDATLSGGTAMINNAMSLGTGMITSNGGAIQAASPGLSLSNSVSLGSGGLTLLGANSLTLSGTLGGPGALIQNGTGVLTLAGANTYSGGTILNGGGLLIGNASALGSGALTVGGNAALDDQASITLANDIQISSGAMLTLVGSNNLALSGTIAGTGTLTKNGAGTTTLAGQSTYTGGTTINAGTLAIGPGGSLAATGAMNLSTAGATLDMSAGGNQTIGALQGVLGSNIALGTNTLTFGDSTNATFAGVIDGTGSLIKQGTGTETLAGSNTYAGNTTINAGTLSLASGGSLSVSSTLDIAGAGAVFDISTAGNQTIGALNGVSGTTVTLGSNTLTLAKNTNQTFAGAISGTGGLNEDGTGVLTLNGSNTFTGITTVASGATLLVGDSSHTSASIAGDVSINGGTLGGYGTVQGSITLSNGATLAPGSTGAMGTLTIGSNLTLGDGSQLDFDFGTPGANFSTAGQSDHVVVDGNLSIGSTTLNVNNLGGMGPGLYNLFTWSGSLSITDGGFTPPAGMSLQILTINKQINLIDAQGLTLNQWNANGLASSSQMGGGSGTWSVASSTWANTSGQYVGPMSPQPTFAIFGGAAGTVTVSDTAGMVSATGMQFVSDGYHLTGDAIDLVGQGGVAPVLRVSSGDTAVIDNVLSGTDGFNKTDGGTLVLTGSNTYTGTTTLSGGTLSVSSDASLGNGANSLDFEGGMLEVTGTTFTHTARNITWGSAGGGFDIDDVANVFTVAQALTGSGGLVKGGAGTLVLTSADTFSGSTTINGGVLALSGNGSVANSAEVNVAAGATFDISNTSSGSLITSLAGNGTVNLGGQTLTLTGANGAFAGSITGTGGLTLAGGSETLTGANLYSGATVIDAGILALSGTGTLGLSSSVTVANGATLDISNATSGSSITSLAGSGTVNLGSQSLTLTKASGSFSGTIAGSGGLTLAAGLETLSGSNTYAGGTTINGGTLSIASDANLGAASGGVVLHGGTLENTATFSTGRAISLTGNGILQTDADLVVSGNITGGGALTKSGNGSLTLSGSNTYSGGTTITAGTLVVDSASLPGTVTDHAALVFNQVSDGAFGGAISGNGSLAKTGAGTLILDGDSGDFAGTTTVQAGTLEVGDAGTPSAVLGGNVTVASGGTLRGHGTIDGNVTNDGIVWAGGSIGTLTVQGNYTQAAGGVLQVEATPDGQASLLRVGGTANLAGTALVLSDTGNWAPLTNYTVLTAAGGITGQFASTSSSLAFLSPTLVYGTSAITLSLQRNDISFSTVAQTPNQRAVATAANQLGFGNAVYDALVALNATDARSAFNQLSGEIHASTRTAIQDDDRYVRDAINQHLAGMTNDANGLNVTNDSGVTAWTAVWGHWGSHDSDGNASSFTANGSGVLVGGDLPVGDGARLGAVVGSGQGTTRIATQDSSSHVVNQHIGVYGSAQTGPLQWQGGAIYGLQRVDSSRTIDVGSLAGTANSDYHAHTVQGYVDASWPVVLGNATLAPFANLAYDNLHTPAFGESGTPAALDVASEDSSVGYGTLGLRASFDLGGADHGLHAHVGLGWQHAWGDALPTATMRFASGASDFDITGLPVARNAGTVSGGINFTITPSVSVDASYQGQFAQRASDQAARISLDWRF